MGCGLAFPLTSGPWKPPISTVENLTLSAGHPERDECPGTVKGGKKEEGGGGGGPGREQHTKEEEERAKKELAERWGEGAELRGLGEGFPKHGGSGLKSGRREAPVTRVRGWGS